MHLPDNTLLQGGKYRIIRFIASGGFGCTYEATHTMIPGSRIVIKELFIEDFCNREHCTQVTVATQSKVQLFSNLKKKFFEEGVALFNMHHPSIVRVTDVFEENGTAYYAMDFIDGHSLQEIVGSRGRIPESTALEYMRSILDAVEYVHSLNRLHLDIKPSNIMISSTGRPVLIDFGASKQYDERSKEQLSTLLGVNTYGYAPVEQINRTFRHFSAATDIYAIGATLYKMLTGKTPPNAVSMLSEEESLAPLSPCFSPSTRNAVAQALKLLRADRPQSISEFRDLLFGNSSSANYASGAVYNDEKTRCDYDDESDTKGRRTSIDNSAMRESAKTEIDMDYVRHPAPAQKEGKGFAKFLWFVFSYIVQPILSCFIGFIAGFNYTHYYSRLFGNKRSFYNYYYVSESCTIGFSLAFAVLVFFLLRIILYKFEKNKRMQLYGKETSSGRRIFYLVMLVASIISLFFLYSYWTNSASYSRY